MKINKIDDNFSATEQVTTDDVSTIKAAGFASIICNRPDNESSEQPNFEEIAATAKAKGIVMVYIPLLMNKTPSTEIQMFADAMESLPRPILGYCRSGLRSVALWSLMQREKDNLSIDKILTKTTTAGYDVSKIVTLK